MMPNETNMNRTYGLLMHFFFFLCFHRTNIFSVNKDLVACKCVINDDLSSTKWADERGECAIKSTLRNKMTIGHFKLCALTNMRTWTGICNFCLIIILAFAPVFEVCYDRWSRVILLNGVMPIIALWKRDYLWDCLALDENKLHFSIRICQ